MKKAFFFVLAMVLTLLMLVACNSDGSASGSSNGSDGGSHGSSNNNNNARNQGLNLPLLVENQTFVTLGGAVHPENNFIYITNEGNVHIVSVVSGRVDDSGVLLNNVRSVYHYLYGRTHAFYAIQNDNTLWARGSGRIIGDGTNVDRDEFIKIADDVALVITPLVHQHPSSQFLGFIKTDQTLWQLGVEPSQVAENIIRPLNGRYFLRNDGAIIELSRNNEIIETGITNVIDAYFIGTILAGANELNNPERLQLSARTLWYVLSYDGVLSYVETHVVHADGISTNEIFFSRVISDNVTSMLAGGEFSTNMAARSTDTSFVHFFKNDNTLWGVGANSGGQLGDGTRVDRDEPVRIADDVSSINFIHGVGLNASFFRRGFIKMDGTPWKWTDSAPTPEKISSYSFNRMLLASGALMMIGITQDGRYVAITNDGRSLSIIDRADSERWIENIMLPSTITFR